MPIVQSHYEEPYHNPALALAISIPQPSGEAAREFFLQKAKSFEHLLNDRQDGMTITLKRLINLIRDDEYDEDYLPPTRFAFNRAQLLLDSARPLLQGNVPLGSLAADGAGGIRIDWLSVDKEVRLVLPGKEQGRQYIYHQQGEEYAAEHTVNAEFLAYWLNWLISV